MEQARDGTVITPVSGPCDLPDTPENRARIGAAFREFIGSDDGRAMGRYDGAWIIRSMTGGSPWHRVLYSDAPGSVDGLAFEEVR